MKAQEYCNYLKYFPVTFANDGSNAQNKVVCAPCLGLLIKGHTSGFKKIAENQLLKKLMCLIISVSTIPGCTALHVTPESKIKNTCSCMLKF